MNGFFYRSWGIHDEEIPPWQKAILKVAWPLLRKFLIKVLDVTKENADACLKKAEEFFEQTDKMLAKNQYLMGTEEPTYIGKKHALKIHDQFTLNTSCFWEFADQICAISRNFCFKKK